MISAVYILVAKRLKIDIQGVGAPGHFIVKHGDRYLDPFFGGREVTKEECVIRAQELNVFWKDDFLEPIDDEAMIDSMKIWFSPGAMAIYGLLGSLFFGAIISLIVAAVMKKNPPGHI